MVMTMVTWHDGYCDGDFKIFFFYFQDHINDLQAQADKFVEKEHHDKTIIKEKAETITTRYEKYEAIRQSIFKW